MHKNQQWLNKYFFELKTRGVPGYPKFKLFADTINHFNHMECFINSSSLFDCHQVQVRISDLSEGVLGFLNIVEDSSTVQLLVHVIRLPICSRVCTLF